MFKKLKNRWAKIQSDRYELAVLRRFVRMMGIVAFEQGSGIIFDSRGVTIEAYKMDGETRVRKFQITAPTLEDALIDAVKTISEQGQG